MQSRTLLVGVTFVFVALLSPLYALGEPCDSNDERELCEERDIYLMPGVTALGFFPAGASDPFIGGGVQLAPVIWTHNNDNFGPGQGVVYLQAAILSSAAHAGKMSQFEAGTTLALERNSSRTFGIPYFGFAFGTLTQRDYDPNSYIYTLLGAHLFFNQNLVVDLEGGYHFPFADIDFFRGLRIQSVLRFSMW